MGRLPVIGLQMARRIRGVTAKLLFGVQEPIIMDHIRLVRANGTSFKKKTNRQAGIYRVPIKNVS